MKYSARIIWQKSPSEHFLDNKYSRAHNWYFDGGAQVMASSSPAIVPEPMSNPAAVDPEEALIASLSSCHMLFFLAIAATKRITVESYEDKAEGIMSKMADGRTAMTEVSLRPLVRFAESVRITSDEHSHLHHLAHKQCFIAHSVIAKIQIFPTTH